MSTTLAPDTMSIFRDNLARLQANAAVIRDRQEQAEREAEAQAAREAAELAGCSMSPANLIDPSLAAQMKEHGTGLLALMRRWQDSKHKYESNEREIGNWSIAPIETDEDLERGIALRVELEGCLQVLTFDGRRRLAQKIVELQAAIASAKGRFLYSITEPVFKTSDLFADPMFSQHRCRVVSDRRGDRSFVLPIASLAASNPKTAQRITDLFTACGAEFFPGEFGASVILEPREMLRNMNPVAIEYIPPASPSIDGIEGIVNPTTRAVKWYREKQAEQERLERESEDARLACARADRERRKAELRDAMQDDEFRSEIFLMLAAPQPIQSADTQSTGLQPTPITAQPSNALEIV